MRDGKAQLIARPGPYQGSDRHLRFVAGEYLDMIVFGNRPRMVDVTACQMPENRHTDGQQSSAIFARQCEE